MEFDTWPQLHPNLANQVFCHLQFEKIISGSADQPLTASPCWRGVVKNPYQTGQISTEKTLKQMDQMVLWGWWYDEHEFVFDIYFLILIPIV